MVSSVRPNPTSTRLIIQPKLASPRFKADPYPFYARLRAADPVYRASLGAGRHAWLITRYDDVAAVLKDDRFAKDPRNALTAEQYRKEPWVPGFLRPLAHNMLDQDAPDHTRLRALVHKAFTPRMIEQLRDRIQSLCDHLLVRAQQRGGVDLIRDYALPLPVIVIAQMLGVAPRDRHKFHRWSQSVVAVSSARDLPRVIVPMWLFLRFLRRLIARRRAQPRDDLISALIQVEEAGTRLSQDELLAMIFLLLIAGHETTVNLIGNGTLALIEHPDQMDRLRGEPSLIRPAIEELLRFSSPVDWATERYAREDITIAGTTIPRGELVHAVLGSANRDERQFPDPDRLDLSREPNRHLAFGQGPHYCLGAPLARLEGQIAIGTLVRRFADLRLTRPAATLRWRRGLILRGLESLPVALA